MLRIRIGIGWYLLPGIERGKEKELEREEVGGNRDFRAEIDLSFENCVGDSLGCNTRFL